MITVLIYSRKKQFLSLPSLIDLDDLFFLICSSKNQVADMEVLTTYISWKPHPQAMLPQFPCWKFASGSGFLADWRLENCQPENEGNR